VTAGRARQQGRGLPYLILDVFAEAPLQGNQLGVFTDAVGVGSEQMQRLARELNFSETAFLLPPEQEGDARVRIFTPDHELPFAGHPVLGSAVAVGARAGNSEVRLETGLGLIPVALRWQSERGAFGLMQQRVPQWSPYEHEAELLSALGITRSGLPVEAYPNGPLHVYVELQDEGAVAELRPDMRALAELEACANTFAGHGKRWKTRMFAASYGVDEDPATGSAAGPLALHLARHGRIAFGEEIEIRQGIEIGRPSVLYARVEGSPERVERVEVGGSAVIVARGEFLAR
jgi:trans-2,3-dihydro-3-hydroxyanthranilate isomerase